MSIAPRRTPLVLPLFGSPRRYPDRVPANLRPSRDEIGARGYVCRTLETGASCPATSYLYATAEDALAGWDAGEGLGTSGIPDPAAIREASLGGRLGAALTPERLRDQTEVDWAVGLLAG